MILEFGTRRVGKRQGIRTYVAALVLAVLVPLLALSTLIAVRYARAQQDLIEARRTDILNNLGFLVDRDIVGTQRGLQALAISPGLRGDLLDNQFRQHTAAVFPDSRIKLRDRTGQVIVSTQNNAEESQGNQLVRFDLQAVFDGKLTVTGFRSDTETKRQYFIVAAPVIVDNRVAYALSADIDVKSLNYLFAEAQLPPEWFAAIVDRDGLILARNVNIERFAGQRSASQAAVIAMQATPRGTFSNTSLDGIATDNAFQKSTSSGWTLFVAVPSATLHAPLNQAYNFLATAGIVLTAGGLGLAFLLSNRIAGSARNLELAARNVIEGGEVKPGEYPIAEFGSVAKVFEFAAATAAQQKLDEQRIKESEERQRLAIEAGGFGTFDLDLVRGTAVWSPYLLSLIGYSQPMQTVPSGKWLDRVHPADRAYVEATIKSALTDKRAYSVEYRIFRADTNEVRWLRTNGQFHFGHDGKATRVVGVVRDVTDRKMLELTLRENETRYKSALTVGRMGSWETNFATGIRTWSTEAMELFGLSLPGGLGRLGGDNDELVKAVHPDDRASFHSLYQLARSVDSFSAEYRIIRSDGTIVWLSGRGQVFARASDGKCLRLMSVMADVTEQRKAGNHLRFLLREMSHRSKNLLAVIQSIARQTMRTSGSMTEFTDRFERRLHGLAASHDILVGQNWEGAALANLVRSQIAPFVELSSARVEVNGPAIDLDATAAQAVGLALHELATNAVKYGALSDGNGKVRISWRYDATGGERALILSWVEEGGPAVTPPSRKGFGNAVIESMAPKSVLGSVSLEYAPSGLHWHLTIPESSLIGGEGSAPDRPDRRRTDLDNII